MLRWLERRIDPFASFDEPAMPPTNVAGFVWHYLSHPLLARRCCSLRRWRWGSSNPSLYVLMGRLVDMLAKSAPERLWSEHGGALIGMAALILFVRPALHFLNEGISNQIIVPQSTNMVRCSHASGHAWA